MARAWSIVLAGATVTACTSEAPRPDPLGSLPPPAPVDTERFRDSGACAQCHLVPDGAAPLHDADGHNVSPVLLWRSSMMALAARDPYYLAVFAEERARAPASVDAVDALCTRCHAPAGAEELAGTNQHLSFADLTAGTTDAAAIGRDGVTCTLCHQIDASGLGEDRTFSGGFSVGYQRKLYGRYINPVTSWMELIVNFTPTPGSQIAESSLCATCHTVIVPTASGDVVEQATFLEWRSSMYAAAQPCQTCHVPTTDDAGAPITVLGISGTPSGLAPRTPFGRHTFVGGSSYLLRLLADAVAWAGTDVPADELLASAARDDAHLAGAARLTVVATTPSSVTVRVANQTGHKLPTGYPSRRVWLHVRVDAADGSVVFESGATDAAGAIVDRGGHALAAQPHHDVIASDAQVQVWEATLIDGAGAATHRALDARRYTKDDRILPTGFAPTGTDRTRTLPVGVVNDATFVPGSDDVTYQLPAGGANLHVELLYESLSPAIVDAIDAGATPAGTRFVDLVRARPVTPIVMATLDLAL
jgi:hypothetical protein